MSTVKSKVDVGNVAGGAAKDAKGKDKGKKAAAAAAAPEEGKELSKKERNKLEAKLRKENAKKGITNEPKGKGAPEGEQIKAKGGNKKGGN